MSHAQIISCMFLASQFVLALSFQVQNIVPCTRGPNKHISCLVRIPAKVCAIRRQVLSTKMAVGDVISLEWALVSEVQEGIRAAMADGNRLIEVEVPTTNKFKDKALNQIYQANTEVRPDARILLRVYVARTNQRIRFFFTSFGGLQRNRVWREAPSAVRAGAGAHVHAAGTAAHGVPRRERGPHRPRNLRRGATAAAATTTLAAAARHRTWPPAARRAVHPARNRDGRRSWTGGSGRLRPRLRPTAALSVCAAACATGIATA